MITPFDYTIWLSINSLFSLDNHFISCYIDYMNYPTYSVSVRLAVATLAIVSLISLRFFL